MNLEELFLESPKLTDEENHKKRDRAFALSRDPVLQELFRTSYKTRILDILSFISERKFEEAFAQMRVVEALQSVQSVLEDSLSKVEGRKVDNSLIKY